MGNSLQSIANTFKKGFDAYDAKLAGSSDIMHWNVATGEWTRISVIDARQQQKERRIEKEKLEAKKRIARYLGNR